MSNIDNWYAKYEEMTDLIAQVKDDDLKADLFEKLQWLKTFFDCYRGERGSL